MGNQTWLAEVLFAGLSEGEREHALDVMGEATDAELRRLRAQGARKAFLGDPRLAATIYKRKRASEESASNPRCR